MESPFNAWQEVSLDWKLSVLDNQGVEILNKKGLTTAKRLNTKASLSMDPFINEMSAIMSEQLTELGKEWGSMLYSSEELRNYAKQKKSLQK
jgi:predicted hydrocarbon binding protein